MTNTAPLRCDGCGQVASAEHVARRVQRLEWTTRYRPIHIGTLFLGAFAPISDAEFLYAARTAFGGEASALLEATGLQRDEKPAEAKLTEFQRGGFFLAHVLDCPLERVEDEAAHAAELLQERLPFVLSRIRRSLKPKRVAPISKLLEPLIRQLQSSDLGCALLLDGAKPFALDGDYPDRALAHLQERLSAVAATTAR
jgi:hypothetical protein